MAGIGLILNPHARGNRRSPRRLARFQSILGTEGEALATANLGALDDALERFHERRVDVLAVCGGDGSFHTVVSRALGVWNDGCFPLLLPLRGGTINNLSHSLGGRRCSAEKLLTQVVERVRRGSAHDVTECDLMLVNGRYYGYIVGAAMIVKFLRLYYAGARPGPVRALCLLARLGTSYLFGTSTIQGVAAPVQAEVTCDGTKLPFTSYRLLLASSVASIGLGVKPFYLSGREHSRFHVLAGPSTPGELFMRLPRFYRGAAAELPTLFDSAASVVRIEFAEPQAFTINGDIPAEQVTVLELRPGPRVRLIRG